MGKKSFLSLFIFFFCFQIFAREIDDINNAFQKGDYTLALELLKGLEENPNNVAAKYYLMGVSFSRLQFYDKAIRSFGLALKNNNDSKDIFYEYGQALYAANFMEKAFKAFRLSYNNNYKTDTSLYYMAHISQVLERYKDSKSYYIKTIKDKNTDKGLKQVSFFQLGEVSLAMERSNKNIKKIFKEKIYPYFKKALALDPKSKLSSEIRKRLAELKREYGLDPNYYVNGRRIPQKRFDAYFKQDFKYDNNITFSNDLPSTTATQKDSYIFNSEAQATYLFTRKRKHTHRVGARVEYLKHSDQDSDTVFTNDAYTLVGTFKSTKEGKSFDNPSSFLYDFEYWYRARDRDSNHSLLFYSRSLQYTIGQKFKYFKSGDTTLMFRYKTYRAFDESLDNNTMSFIFTQVSLLSSRYLLILYGEADFIDNFNSPDDSTDNYILSLNLLMPEFIPSYTLNWGLSYSMLDTKAQSETRGTETNLSPSIEISRKVSNNFKISFSYKYTINSSLSDTYDYKKHVTTTQIRYNF